MCKRKGGAWLNVLTSVWAIEIDIKEYIDCSLVQPACLVLVE